MRVRVRDLLAQPRQHARDFHCDGERLGVLRLQRSRTGPVPTPTRRNCVQNGARMEAVSTRTYSRPGSSPESSISPTFSADAASYSSCTAHAASDTIAPVAVHSARPARTYPT